MPYKKESPFASFRDPKRPTRNYNPTNFQMPDINSIYNKTADGDKVEETTKSDEKDPKKTNYQDLVKKIDNPDPAPITKKSLRQDRKVGEKEFNKELRRNKRLSKASTKDITAEERDFYERAVVDIQQEKDFRKEAKKEGFNPADYKKIIEEQKEEQRKADYEASKTDQDYQYQTIGLGPKMIKNMKQVNSKGSGFPMLQPNQNMAEPEQIKNRAGRSMESNILTNDPNINQPMNKVAGSNFQRNAKFNDIASGQGVYNPPQSTMPMPNQPMGNQTPQQQTFPQQGSFALYDGPEFNEGLKKASAEGKLDDNPKFKAAVDNAPGMYMMKGEGKKNVIANLDITKGKKEDYEVKGTKEYNKLQKEYKGNTAQYLDNRFPKRKSKGQSSLGMYNGPAKSFKAFDHAHTKVTKGNLKATERDDAAHMSYLKRDIKYDNTHGGSKKQMLDDEKHISKLAGDLKYDAKKKRS